MTTIVLGTAGHIDHGKSALVRALTGTDPDRLKEERERGITIDLGFASLRRNGLEFSIVDVPGHEQFVRNMLAGASGIDVALLVVAADEGVMPQTREHLAILDFLGIEQLVVAITKRDLVEDDWLELARLDLDEFLEDSRFAGAPVIVTSATRGDGLEELQNALATSASRLPTRSRDDLARMPVDRVFTVRGTGTVLTGTLWSGRIAVGDGVRILTPGDRAGARGEGATGLSARVRGIEVHGAAAGEVVAGQRAALALAGVDHDRVTRGDVVVDSEAWEPTRRMLARVRVLEGAAPIDRGRRVRVHLGTREVMARALPREGDSVAPGGEAWVEFRLEAPLIARARDRFVIRSYSPVTTIAGGTVAEPAPPRRRRRSGPPGDAEAVLAGTTAQAVLHAVAIGPTAGVRSDRLPVLVGWPPDLVHQALEELGERLRTVGGRLFPAERVARLADAIERAVHEYHQRHPIRAGMPLQDVRSQPDPSEVVQLALDELTGAVRLELEGAVLRAPGFKPAPSESDRRRLQRVSRVLQSAGLQPPGVSDLAEADEDRADVWDALVYLENRGDITRIEDDLFVWSSDLEAAAGRVRAELAGRSGLGPSDFREVVPVTRKHLIPILGHFDRTGVTVRDPGGRSVAPD